MKQHYFKHNETIHDIKLELNPPYSPFIKGGDREKIGATNSNMNCYKAITSSGEEFNIGFLKTDDGKFEVVYNNTRYHVIAKHEKNKYYLWIDGESVVLGKVEPKTKISDNKTGQRLIIAPMPGILHLKVKDKEEVKQNQVVAFIESMKMQNEILSPCAGTIKLICKDTVGMINTGEKLMEIIGS